MSNLQDWINWQMLKHSSATATAYAWEIHRLESEFKDRDLIDLSVSDLLKYLVARRAAGAGDAAIYRAVNALRSFYGFVGLQTAKGLPMKKPAKREQRTLTFEEAKKLVASFDTSTRLGRRDLALCALMMDSALRAAEICRLDLSKVDLEARLLYVVVKGGQEEFGIFTTETANFLSVWMSDRAAIAKCTRLFVSFEAHRLGYELTPGGLRCIFHRIGREAGIPDLSPHVLRRTFATLSILMGVPTRVVQEIGRWHDLALVEQYTRAVKAKSIDRRSLPMAGIMGSIR